MDRVTRPSSFVAWLLAALACLSGASCIERPPSSRDSRTKFDRSALSDVLLSGVPSAARRLGANFGGIVELSGLDVTPASPHPGDVVTISYYLKVLDDVDEDYKVFVHADGRGGQERINGDHWPARGRYPTSAWRKGEVVRDTFTLQVPSYFAGVAIDVWTGFYVPSKDERAPLVNRTEIQHDGQNRALAITLPVR